MRAVPTTSSAKTRDSREWLTTQAELSGAPKAMPVLRALMDCGDFELPVSAQSRPWPSAALPSASATGTVGTKFPIVGVTPNKGLLLCLM